MKPAGKRLQNQYKMEETNLRFGSAFRTWPPINWWSFKVLVARMTIKNRVMPSINVVTPDVSID